MQTYVSQDARTRAIRCGETTALRSTVLDGRKHYGIMRFVANYSVPEVLVVNLTGGVLDTLAEANALAEEMQRRNAWCVRVLGFHYYAVRIA